MAGNLQALQVIVYELSVEGRVYYLPLYATCFQCLVGEGFKLKSAFGASSATQYSGPK